MKVRGKVKTQRPLPKRGLHPFCCIAILDLGTQKSVWKGQEKASRKLNIVIELLDEKHVFDEEKGPQPFILDQRFTATLSTQGSLLPLLEEWAGKKFDDNKRKEFDLSKLIGAYGMVNVVYNQDKEIPTINYANIGSFLPLMDNIKVSKPVNPLCHFTMDPDEKCFVGKKPAANDPKGFCTAEEALEIMYTIPMYAYKIATIELSTEFAKVNV